MVVSLVTIHRKEFAMTEIFIKAVQLDPTDYDPNQIIVVSDPRVPAGPTKRSLRITTGDIPAQIKPWNITPTTTVNGDGIQYVDLHNAVVAVDGSFHADTTVTHLVLDTYEYAVSAVKTNIQATCLTDDTNAMYGLTTTVLNGGGYVLRGTALAPDTWSAAQLKDTIIELLFSNGVTTTDAFIVTLALTMGVNETNQQMIYNGQSAAAITSANHSPGLAGVGNTCYTLLGGGGVDTAIGAAVVGDDGITYDLYSGITLNDAATFPPSLTLFYFTVQVDPGGSGLGTLTCKPALTNLLPNAGMSVDGTTYGANHADADWALLFPGGFTSAQSVTVTQATYPTSAIVGSVFETYVDAGYVGYPAPYGISTQPLETVQITSLTPGSESHVRLLRGAALSDVWDAMSTLQNLTTAMQSSLTTLSGELSSAALGNDEIVVYVKNFNVTTPLTGVMVFDTFTLAYNYLLTQPQFLRKRIVFDDREYDTPRVVVPAVQSTVYMLLQNNITLSTYLSYTGYPYELPTDSSTPYTVMRVQVDGLLLDKFSGALDAIQTGDPTTLVLTNISAYPHAFDYNLRIGDDCTVWIRPMAIGVNNGGNVLVGERSQLFWDYGALSGALARPIAIYTGAYSSTTLNGSAVNSVSGTGKMLTMYSHASSTITLLSDLGTSVDYYPLDPAITGRFAYDGYTIIRDVADFGNMIQSGYVDLQPGKYWIVGIVDLGDMFISPPGWGHAVIVGVSGSALLSTNHVITRNTYIGTNLRIINVDLVSTGSGTTALTATGVVYLRNVRMYADTPLILNDSQYVTEISADIDGLALYGPLVANSLNFDSTPPVAATSYIKSTDIMVKNVKGVVNGTPLITFGFKSTGVAAYAPPVVIDGVDVIHTYPLVTAVSTFAFYNNPVPAQTQRPNNSVHVNNIRTHGAQPPLWSYNNVATDVSEYPVFVANSNDAGSAVVFGSATCNNQTGGSNLPFTPSWSVANELRFLRSDTAVSMTCLATTRRRYLVRLDGYIASSVSAAGVTLLLRAFIGASQPNVSQVINITTTPKPFTIAMFVSLRLNDVVALNLNPVTNGYDVLLTNLNMVITPV